jgi:hypothetical protein
MSDLLSQPARFKVSTPDGLTLAAARHGSASGPEILLVHEERHTRYEMSRRILDLNPAARMSIYQGVAHAPFYERPERFNRELAAFANGRFEEPVTSVVGTAAA